MKTLTHLLGDLLKQRFWKVKITFLFFVLVMIFSTPYFNYLPKYFKESGWKTVMEQVHSKTIYQPQADPISQDAKKTFRLTVPFIAKILFLNEWGIYILQFLTGMLFIYLMVVFVQRQYNDRLITFYFVLAATSVYFGTACFTDVYSYFSGWAYFFLFMCLFFESPLLIFVMATLAAWTDERGFIALAYVILYWQFRNFSSNEKSTAGLFRLNKQSIAVVTAIVFYLSIRYYLEYIGYNMPMPLYRTKKYLFYNLDLFQIAYWTFFEGFWILVLYKFYLLLKKGSYMLFGINFLIDLVMLLCAVTTGDVTRSGSFMVLEVFISAIMIYRICGIEQLKIYVKWSSIVCLLFPPYYVITIWKEPIILQRNIFSVGLRYIFTHYIAN